MLIVFFDNLLLDSGVCGSRVLRNYHENIVVIYSFLKAIRKKIFSTVKKINFSSWWIMERMKTQLIEIN